MTALADFDDMLAQSIVYKPFSSRTAGGTATFGTASTYQARVVNTNKQTRDLKATWYKPGTSRISRLRRCCRQEVSSRCRMGRLLRC